MPALGPLIIDLAAAGAEHRPIGGKGRSLAQTLAAGRNVPPAFALEVAAFEQQLASPGVAAALDACRSRAGRDAEQLAKLREAICETALAPELAAQLPAWLARLGPGPYAVRSSAVDEDGSSRSFAGVHDTVLGVVALDEVVDAIRRVWASAFGERAIAYRSEAPTGSPLDARMAVVVQRLIAAEVSGVAFTRDPRSGERVCVVEAVRGSGEALVSGRVTPVRVVFELDGRIRERSGEVLLDDAQLAEVAALARSLESAQGVAQDVEWSFGERRLWLLQARPVTTGASAAAPIVARGRQVWSNTNTKEVLPVVATPATFDIVRLYVAQLLGPMLTQLGIDLPGDALIGRVAGRVYFNVNALVAMFRALPGLRADGFADTFGGDAAAMKAAIAALRPEDLPVARLRGWRLLVGVSRLSFHALFRPARRLDDDLASFVAETRRISAVSPASLRDDELVSPMHALLSSSFVPFAGIATMLAGFAAVDLLGRLGGRWLRDPVLAGRLLTAMGGLDSAESGLALVRLGRSARRLGLVEQLAALASDEDARAFLAAPEQREFAGEFHEFLAAHGHHARSEVDVATPRWRETPAYVLRQVAALARLPDDHRLADERRRAAEREQIERALLDSPVRVPRSGGGSTMVRVGPLRRAILRALLVRAARTLRFRENSKSEAVRRLAYVRELLLEAGRRLAARGVIGRADDVFMLGLDETARALVTPCLDWNQRVARRRAELERLRAIVPPGLVIGEFDPTSVLVASAIATASGTVLEGLPVSAGRAEGRARVVESTDAGVTLEAGEVLVAPFTDPGWTPYFVSASAVVMEFGGQLSHGSIVAREYGLPAVVNVADVMRRIRTGQRVRVDGDAGTVTVLDAD